MDVYREGITKFKRNLEQSEQDRRRGIINNIYFFNENSLKGFVIVGNNPDVADDEYYVTLIPKMWRPEIADKELAKIAYLPQISVLHKIELNRKFKIEDPVALRWSLDYSKLKLPGHQTAAGTIFIVGENRYLSFTGAQHTVAPQMAICLHTGKIVSTKQLYEEHYGELFLLEEWRLCQILPNGDEHTLYEQSETIF